MKSHVLQTVWCDSLAEAAGEIGNWSLFTVKSLSKGGGWFGFENVPAISTKLMGRLDGSSCRYSATGWGHLFSTPNPSKLLDGHIPRIDQVLFP